MAKLPAQKTVDPDDEDDDEIPNSGSHDGAKMPEGMFNSVQKPKVDAKLVEAILQKPSYDLSKLEPGQQVPLHAANIQSRDTQRDHDERRRKAVTAAVDAALK